MKALNNRVLIRPEALESQTEGGVHLPDTVRQTSNVGVVVDVGPGARLEDGTRATPEVSKGDRVVIDARGNLPSKKINGETLLMCYENQIAILLEEGDEVDQELVSDHPKPKLVQND